MGLTLIFPEDDVLMARACAYALHQSNNNNHQKNKDAMTSTSTNNNNPPPPPKRKVTRILKEGRTSRQDDPFLISCAPHGLTIEVGPVPQGVLRRDAVLSTENALEAVLEFLNLHNTDPQKALTTLRECYPEGTVPCFFYEGKIPVCI